MNASLHRIASFLLALGLTIIFAACCLTVPSLRDTLGSLGNLNLLVYGMAIILFCILFLVIDIILSRLPRGIVRQSSDRVLLLSAILILMHFLFLCLMVKLEGNIYGGVSERYVWHKLPAWLILLFLTGEIFIFFCCVRGYSGSMNIGNVPFYCLYAILTVLIGYTFYTPATFVRGYSDRLHANAYYNSIYNVMHNAPYSEQTASMYGHYGILYKLPMQILGGDYIDFILLIAILGALCFLLTFVTLHLMVGNRLLRFLGTVCVTFPILSMRGGYYWQLWPHRILFMCLMLCYAAILIRFRKLNRLTCLLGYLLCTLAILWNTESGIFCAIAWAGFWFLRYLSDRNRKLLGTAGTTLLHIAGITLSFLTAYGIVNLYNLSAGGSANSLNAFLFPLVTDSYMNETLRVDLPLFPSAYMVCLALFLLAAAWGLSRLIKPEESAAASPIPCYAFFTAVLSLGQMSYFMNRASYHNLDIVHIPAILLICLLSEQGMGVIASFRWKRRDKYQPAVLLKASYSVVGLTVLLAVTTGTLVQYGYNADLKTEFHDKDGLTLFAAHIASEIPENTYAFGIGVAEIYSILRWDTQCYTLDFADISVCPDVADSVIDDIKSRELPGFLAGEKTTEKLREYASDHNEWIEEYYEVAEEFEYQGCIFQYYTRKK